ncbi:iron uptake transporter deferrochelatase/peroxidase subunit [Labrys monachus]|uniref:Deferrochelatase n=1 Tax=Labrys monachus TaxID=217067 RepID=A0ABU0FC78_9HYPH|nr:iron uptake transporter deferrochelatase/peroxidase subunit [Labrys monachus]MDQ0392214.1 deferrochelatase/peroxidase EfeB [Labrys monachus]
MTDKILSSPSPGTPASPGRRSMLLGLGVAGGGALLGALSPAAAETNTGEPGAVSSLDDRVPYLGTYQAGVTTPRQPVGLAVAFNVLATGPADLQRLFRVLTARIAFLTQGGTPPVIDAKFPPPDSGLMGPVVAPDNLTITVAVGPSLFDGRFGLQSKKPLRLKEMPQFKNDALNGDQCHGDLLLQICSNTADSNIHALRDIVKNTPDLLMVRWKQEGFVPPPRALGERQASPRNLLGFKDGTANPAHDDLEEMKRVVWVQPDSGEPEWAVNGTYAVVRIIRNFVERWDRTPLQEQESIIGRDKPTGAPLGMKAEFDLPVYSNDPDGKRTPLDSHIRLANPRTPGSEKNLILRRPFNYSNGVTKSGQLDMGLLFICFQADLDAGFATVQDRLNGEPLEEYIKPVGGGYFFVLPGIADKNAFIGQSLLEVA